MFFTKPLCTTSLTLIQSEAFQNDNYDSTTYHEHVFSETCQNKTSYYDSRRNAKKIIFSISRFRVANTKYALCWEIDFLTLSRCTYISIFGRDNIYKQLLHEFTASVINVNATNVAGLR